MEQEKKLRKVIEAKWASHKPEFELAINTGLRKGSQYGLTWDTVDWIKSDVKYSADEEPIHVPMNDAAVAALRVVHERAKEEGVCSSRPGRVNRLKTGGIGLTTR
jgi:hypothetical protein